MGSQTNRNLASKHTLATRQRGELAAAEYSKPAYHTKATEYDDTGVAVTRVEIPTKMVVRIAFVEPHCYTAHRPSWDKRTPQTEILVSARIEERKPLTGKRAAIARLKQHW